MFVTKQFVKMKSMPFIYSPFSDRPLGKFRHRQTGLCVQKPFRTSPTSNQPSGAAIMDKCQDHEFYVPQLVVVTDAGYIMADESVCLDSPVAHEDEATVRYQVRVGVFFVHTQA